MKEINFLKNIGIYTNILQFRIEADLYQKPDDFVVEEIFPKYRCSIKKEKAKKQPNPLKKYIEATLVKKNISTFDACKVIAEKNGFSLRDISYCGLKDTSGITAQRICVPNMGKLRYIKFNRFFLKDFQGSDKKLKVRGHKGNHFMVRAKNISSSPEISKILVQDFKKMIRQGLPNFYWLQRFGIRQNNHILGKLILKGKYKKFVFKFLTDTNKNEPREIRMVRNRIKKNFGNLSRCRKFIQGYDELADEKQLIKDLVNRGEEQAVRNMKLSKFFISSLSSYLFNLALSRYLKENKNKEIKNVKLEKIGGNTKFNKINSTVYLPILKKEGIKLSDFKALCEEFKIGGHPRNIFFFPKNFEFRTKKRNIIVEFDLGIGEYASLFLDFIFNNRLNLKLN